jgi:subtilase family serine protease
VLKHRIVLAAIAIAAAAAPSAHAAGVHSRNVCGPPAKANAGCHAKVVTDGKGQPLATAGPTGLNPADIQAAYKLSGGLAGTVAIVDAYDLPTAEADLNTYRRQFGLGDCTTANGCFRKINQRGGTAPPRANGGWGQEIALDMDMVSAACPACRIVLVEADNNSFANLGAAVDTAAAQPGVVAISNSYGGSEFSQETQAAYNGHYNHPAQAVTVSSGDAGYGAEFPAASQFVTAVGGTSLRRATNARGWTETAWSGAGSGCSAYVPKPSWQKDTGCARRTLSDVSAVADPATGVSVYDSTKYQGASGWMVFGGTSASAPIIAAVFARGGHTAPSTPYGAASALFDVTSGSNGSCGGSYLCTAAAGYDGPTGLGTPNGLGAF